MEFTHVKPDLPRKLDPTLGSKLRLVRPITNPNAPHLSPNQIELSPELDEELLDYTREAVRKLQEDCYAPKVFEQNGLVLVNNKLETLPRTPALISALIETSGGYGPNARTGVFVNCHPEDEGTYASFPGTGGAYEPALSINGKTLILGEMDTDLRRKKALSKVDLIKEERRHIMAGGWVASCDEYTAEDAMQAVYSFRQGQIQKRKALETFLKGL